MMTVNTKHISIAELTTIIKTFERPESLNRLIRSVRRYYPQMQIVVADDSLRENPRDDVDYLRLPSDSGVGAGRNALLQHVTTPYFLTLDDDFELTEKTRIERLLEIVAQEKATIAAGNCLRCKQKFFRVKYRPQPYFGKIDLKDGHLVLSRGCHSRHDGYMICDIVPQFFVADTAAIQALGGWDSRLKTNDHQEFFVRVKQRGLRVAYCPSVSVLHWHTMPKEYANYRKRDHRAIAARKMGVTKWTEMDGRVFTFHQEDDHSDTEGTNEATDYQKAA